MLSVFPDLLSFSLLAVTAIRLISGLVLVYIGILTVSSKRFALTQKFSLINYPMVNSMPWILGIIEIVTGGFLVAGFLTQVVAIIAAYLFLNVSLIDNNEPKIFNQGRLFYVIMILISLTLLFSGAGLFALDLPL